MSAAGTGGGVYAITNTPTGKRYIGSSARIVERWRGHAACLAKGTHANKYLQAAWNKYGSEAFVWSVLEEIADQSQLLAREAYHIAQVQSEQLYNIGAVGAPMRGLHHSDDAKARIGSAARGNGHARGYRHTPEALAKISASSAARRYPNKRPALWSEEAKKRNRGRQRGRVLSQEHRDKIKLSWQTSRAGWKHSDESRAAIGRAHKGRQATPETIAKMRIAAAAREARKREERRA